SAQNTVLRLQIRLMKSVSYTYDKAKLMRFEEIFEEYKIELLIKKLHTLDVYRAMGLYLI
ncbi:hypothetical protein, partial [Streptococcus pseudopneumoniae]|uniref:hypothetical protein n=1 Tax=Streptococcus pseudopneumoniae TaxID=257758 RepID=UPI001C65BC20